MPSQTPKRLDVTVEQLRSIYGQLYDQLEQKAALHLPTTETDSRDVVKEEQSNSKEDTVRREVQVQLQDFLSQVMDMASNSLRIINTNDEVKNVRALIMKSQEKYVEPFDLDLNEKVRQKYQEWENETLKLSQLRQNAPAEIKRIYNEAKQDYISALDSRIAALQNPEQSSDLNSDPDSPQQQETAETSDQFYDQVGSRYEQALHNVAEAQRRISVSRPEVNKVRSLVRYLDAELNFSDSSSPHLDHLDHQDDHQDLEQDLE
ncbi:hypothetical protein HG535_0A06600 [Zygotorulaspora mrakii]|uniref:Uncharacterized protein n=1 Tax=Zygotorulaspora mrakii TaxID=42260 RepID=A0A7H9AWE2_ZYGMR|nr:uncharacterized protein HG535_0A06600 [Zygotorulaspora mrakii]QLG70718.1 hypothetical protein HG535_0A06600 [Zygotorulaspora mrakii]